MRKRINKNRLLHKITSDFREIKNFVLIGIINTSISASGMLFFYNVLSLGYWLSSLIMYVSTSIFSFALNRKYTFHGKGSILHEAFKFFCNVGICYFIAYSVSPRLINKVLITATTSVKDQIAMLVAMVLFTGLNYLGQKKFVFDIKE